MNNQLTAALDTLSNAINAINKTVSTVNTTLELMKEEIVKVGYFPLRFAYSYH